MPAVALSEEPQRADDLARPRGPQRCTAEVDRSGATDQREAGGIVDSDDSNGAKPRRKRLLPEVVTVLRVHEIPRVRSGAVITWWHTISPARRPTDNDRDRVTESSFRLQHS